MPVLFLIIIGAAAGFFATRLMDIKTDVITTVSIGVFGALIGGVVLRFILMLGSIAFGFVGAIAGAVLLIWIYQKYFKNRL